MARCANCLRSCQGICCSMECANERMAVMLEGVELLDALMAMVDHAAAERDTAAATRAVVAGGAAEPKPARAGKARPGATDGAAMLLPMAAPQSFTPESLDGAA